MTALFLEVIDDGHAVPDHGAVRELDRRNSPSTTRLGEYRFVEVRGCVRLFPIADAGLDEICCALSPYTATSGSRRE